MLHHFIRWCIVLKLVILLALKTNKRLSENEYIYQKINSLIIYYCYYISTNLTTIKNDVLIIKIQMNPN